MEVVWRFEQRTFYIGSLRVKLILVTEGLALKPSFSRLLRHMLRPKFFFLGPPNSQFEIGIFECEKEPGPFMDLLKYEHMY